MSLPHRAHGTARRRLEQPWHSRPSGPSYVGNGFVRPQSAQGTRPTFSPWPPAISSAISRTPQGGQSGVGALSASGLDAR
ncbi:hypothetical protein [Streptomyces sp. KS 21]|uniref:hypothetical protein n=1 Tax=Streptomyces sp. KS 21 TaxID=2485150 RepID=UPI00141516C1|nr:hypothetical protein [Streptomyces sp. KS 21]